MDLESYCLELVRQNVSFQLSLGLNSENRVTALFESPLGAEAFTIVENTAIHVPVKPPTQRVSAEGFDAHRGMGEAR